ncbi:MAG TPA: RNA-binding transcriptional accessory protein [Bacteroidetes bacterium]|nr:RNA-binding transcriptional accessory protein [Bacteroidota bacterium]
MPYAEIIAEKLNLKPAQVAGTLRLLETGATVPFISRYRKEHTGSLDEVQITAVRDMHGKLRELDARRETVLATIREQEKLTPELEEKIKAASSLTELEDLYLPYRPKKKTRGSEARRKGLEPLADRILEQKERDPEREARDFLNNEVPTAEQALAGARDIIAERINEDAGAREKLRNLFAREAVIESRVVKGKEEEGEKYLDYFNYSGFLKKIPSHRLLAMRRGEEEGFLKVSIGVGEEKATGILEGIFVRGQGPCSEQVKMALTDAFKRLLAPSLETEFRSLSKEQADEEAIRVFAENLRQLLLAPPLGQKRVMGIDPGYRTGCKLVCLDAQGNLLHNETVYPHPPRSEKGPAARKVASLAETYKTEAIAIGNGTAGRETEQFIRNIRFNREVRVYVVNESGASVYSASPVAREEFPEFDVTVRGAISIARRLMDPLAELVKIDPKSIGVGQYQHDVDQKMLKKSLDRVVESCVNRVGVSVNTASKHLLSYVSGLGPQLAENIVQYRKENGPFRSRKELQKVPRLGARAFEQAAGFLRIENGLHPLDNSAVHPESYALVERMAADLQVEISDLMREADLRNRIRLEQYVTPEKGLPTLKDIMQELEKPGRDPRAAIHVFEFDPRVRTIGDLQEGMILPGIVTNITNFGAFVDIGVKHDGLVHISNLKQGFVKNPADVVKLNQHVKVKVIGIEPSRNRIQLSLKDVEQ